MLELTRPPVIPFVSAAWALCRETEESDRGKLDLRGDGDSEQDGGGGTSSHYQWLSVGSGSIIFCCSCILSFICVKVFSHGKYVFCFLVFVFIIREKIHTHTHTYLHSRFQGKSSHFHATGRI